MYVPKQYEETRIEVLHALMRAHPLAALVSHGPCGLSVDHLPWVLDTDRGAQGTLRGHVARANPVWHALSSPSECVAVFQGPQAYVSPSWYPSKHRDGRVVPTWNYAVVHAYGTPRIVEDHRWLRDLVGELTDTQEAFQARPWQVGDAPSDFTARMLEAIVGLEIPIERIEGKWKVSQNKARADRHGVAAGLEGRRDEHSSAMAAMVRERIEPAP